MGFKTCLQSFLHRRAAGFSGDLAAVFALTLSLGKTTGYISTLSRDARNSFHKESNVLPERVRIHAPLPELCEVMVLQLIFKCVLVSITDTHLAILMVHMFKRSM